MKDNLPILLILGAGVLAFGMAKRKRIMHTALVSESKVANIRAQMDQALSEGSFKDYEVLRLMLESETEL